MTTDTAPGSPTRTSVPATDRPPDSGSEDPPASIPRAPRWFLPAVAAIALVGFAIRANYVRTVRVHEKLWGDSYFFYLWPARQLAEGHGFISWNSTFLHEAVPSAMHPPGLIVILAALQKLGFVTPESAMYWMCALGTVTVVLIGYLVKMLAGPRAGIVAAIIAAVYPGIWINDTMVMPETLGIFGLTVALFGVYAFRRRVTWTRLIVASAGFTIAALARPESILLLPLVLVPLVVARRTESTMRRLKLLAGAALVPLLVFGPWTAYNSTRFSKPVILTTGFGPSLVASSCDQAFTGQFLGFYSLSCGLGAPRPAPKPGHPPDESVEDAHFRSQAFAYYRKHWREVPKVVAAREGRMLGVYRVKQTDLFDMLIPSRGSHTFIILTHRIYWGLALLALAAIPLWRRRRWLLYPMAAQLGITMFATALTFGVTRYRSGVELCIVILAATSIDWAIGWAVAFVRRRRNDDADAPPTPAPAPS